MARQNGRRGKRAGQDYAKIKEARMNSIRHGARSAAAVNLHVATGSRRPGIISDCSHGALVPALKPAFTHRQAEGFRTFTLHTSCPDCWLGFVARFWQPEAGGWLLKVQEHLAAGRCWMFRYEDEIWRPAA